MKEELSEKIFIKKANVLDNSFFQYIVLILLLIAMTVIFYELISFEATWDRFAFQVILLFFISVFSWDLSKVTISIDDNYRLSKKRKFIYFSTIIILGIIYTCTSFIMLSHIVLYETIQWELILIISILVINTLVLALVYISSLIRGYYKDIENKKIIEQSIMFIIFICYGIPAVVLTLINTLYPESIPGHNIVLYNLLVAGAFTVSLQGYKNVYPNEILTVIFANFLQDLFSLAILWAALDLTIVNPISFQMKLAFFAFLFFAGRTWREITKK